MGELSHGLLVHVKATIEGKDSGLILEERKKIPTAQNPYAMENLNLTIEMETKFVLVYSTISMPMVSNGMMFLVTTENQRFVNFRQNMDFILKNVTEIKHINITV